MTDAASPQTGEPRRRAESRFSNFVTGDTRPSTYRYVFFLMDETGDMQERGGPFHRSALKAVRTVETRTEARRRWQDVAVADLGWRTRYKHETERLLSDWFVRAGGRETGEAEVVFRPMLNACFKLAAPQGATEISGGHRARDRDTVIQGYVQSDATTVTWTSVSGSVDALHVRQEARILSALCSDLNRLVAWRRDLRIEEETSDVSPSALADLVVLAHVDSDHWLNSFAEQLHKRLPGVGLNRFLRVWNLEGQEAADGFGVSEETLETWFRQGVPAEFAEPLANLSAATDLLLHYLKAERIPAVVRRPAERLDGKSLVNLYSERNAAGVLEACRDMFRFEDVHG